VNFDWDGIFTFVDWIQRSSGSKFDPESRDTFSLTFAFSSAMRNKRTLFWATLFAIIYFIVSYYYVYWDVHWQYQSVMPQNLRLLISLLPTRRQYRLQHSARSRGQLLEMRFLSSARSCFGPKSEQLRPGPARARKVDFFRPDPAREAQKSKSRDRSARHRKIAVRARPAGPSFRAFVSFFASLPILPDHVTVLRKPWS
jgi:hypothetical protein